MNSSIRRLKMHDLHLCLLKDENHWDNMFDEATLSCATTKIHLLYAIVLVTFLLIRIDTFWEKHKDSMNDDILHRIRTRWNVLTITFNDAMYNEALIAIEDHCIVIAIYDVQLLNCIRYTLAKSKFI
uniref:Uncharacterized protein n=1 Tax=Sipha flava TaxID=143950 RepID=A0A2S2QXL3_9HEMI